MAGKPVVSDEMVDDEIAIPSFLAPAGDGFVLRVSGDSMEGAGILDGDLVVVREAGEPRPGDIVAATVSGETTLKRLERQERCWILAPDNPRYKAIKIITEDVKIHGVVIAVLRALRGSSSVDYRRFGVMGKAK
jgi:SOS-response transcriptional repressor LexA